MAESTTPDGRLRHWKAGDGREVHITGTADLDAALAKLRERAMAIDAGARRR